MRPLGHILCELEDYAKELYEDHELQLGDVLALVKAYTEIHYPGAIEEYEDGTRPTYYYGPPESAEKVRKHNKQSKASKKVLA